MKLRLGISEAMSHWSKYNSEKICVSNEFFSLSFKEFNSIINYFSEEEFSKKISDKCIPLLIDNKLILLAAIIAAVRCGKFPAILNSNLKLEEVEFALNDLHLKTVFTEQRFSKQIPSGITLFQLDNSIIDKNRNFYSDKIWESPLMKSTWGILYSSGTTGNPKGIIRSHFSILSELLGWCFELETRVNSHYYIARPIYYTGGLVLALAALLVGGKASLYDNFSPEIYFEHLNKEKTELSFLVPSQIKLLVEYLQENNIDDPPLSKMVLSMGAPFPEKLKIHAKRFLKSDIIESWGNTEGLGTITTQTDLEIRPSSIGKPFLTDDLFIVDENFKKTQPNIVGRLAGKVDSKFSEYNNRKELNDELIKGDLIISEDLGMEDNEGFFYLFGRVSDVIDCSGVKIYPIVLEKIISSFDEVDEVAVIGIDNGTSKVPVGVIKLKSLAIDLDSLKHKINSQLNENEKISDLKTIAEFPKTASGKIKKHELQTLFIEKK